MKFYVGFVIIIIVFLICIPKAEADDDISKAEAAVSTDYIYDQQSTSNSRALQHSSDAASQGPIRKFGRGLCNTIFGIFEIPIQVVQINNTTGGVAALTYGLVKGMGRFLLREGVGVIEIITFPMPLPGCSTEKYGSQWGYGPLMEPEWIFSFQTNPYDFVYPNRPPD